LKIFESKLTLFAADIGMTGMFWRLLYNKKPDDAGGEDMKRRIMVKVFFIILSCIVLLDIPDAESSGSSGIPPLSTKALLNADYRVPNDIGPFVRVIKGKYKWYQESEGGSQSITILDQGVRGDLNGDGIQDAVVLLVYWRGGLGSSTTLPRF